MNDPEPTTPELDLNSLQPVEASPAQTCSQCGAVRAAGSGYCGDCGYIFDRSEPVPTPAVFTDAVLGGRYRLLQLICERGGFVRFRGEDMEDPSQPVPVIILRQAGGTTTTDSPIDSPIPDPGPEVAEDFDLAANLDSPTLELNFSGGASDWPSVAWEQRMLFRAAHLSLPRLMDTFSEDGFTYLVEEIPAGTPLWDAWDQDGVTNRERFGWLMQIAEVLDRLHSAGAIVEGLRPEMVVVTQNGLAILADLSEILPLPLPENVQLRGGFSTAPELLLYPDEVDERADLYVFGAMLYALSLGRELTDLDFTLTGMPRPYLERVPDANPFLARVLAKTFVREREDRFPTDDGPGSDRTGFRELSQALLACQRNLDRVKLDLAAWSTTGIIRSGNEDGVSILHISEGRLDDSDEAALILLVDGMGGMECGEVASAMTLSTLRECLISGPPFQLSTASSTLPTEQHTDLADSKTSETLHDDVDSVPPTPTPLASDKNSPERTADVLASRVAAAFREANHRVFETARAHPSARGMGCTAEVVLIDGGLAIVGHVGDSRIYRMRRGKLAQVTRDHTLVSRLVEFGQITEKEAESHPRRSELHQAVGGRPEVYPDVYCMTLEPGDWLVVCSDGLSNQASADVIQAMLRESKNAERAARRLINMVLLDGAQDNVSVAVVRAS